jgi:hypothetical protein
MNYPARVVVAIAIAALTSAACESTKSSNPLSPTVAGPISGVTITAPKALAPANGSQITSGDPVNLVIENSSSTSQRPFWFEIQVATSNDFSSIVHTAPKVTPGTNGQTSYRVPMAFTANRTYFWRARAVDGANTGPYSANTTFQVIESVHIEPPLPISPTAGTEVDGTSVTLTVRNTAVTGTSNPVSYRFEIATDGNFANMVAIWTTPRSGGDTTSASGPMAVGTTFYWRASGSDGAYTSPYSDVTSFKTKSPTTTPTPPPTGGGGGGGGGGTPAGGWPTNGPAVVAWAQANYPDYLKPSSNRVANMQFLRDRMIEAGICGGMQLGYNAKRGGPEISVDYITENSGGRWIGVDIAHDYDNQSITLQLTWAESPDDPYTSYTPYTGTLPCKK